MKKLWKLKRLWLLLLAPASLALSFAAASSTAFAEWYAVTIYPVLSRGIHTLTSLVPFSVAEVLVAAAVPAALACLAVFLVRLVRRRESRGLRAGRFALNILCAASVLLFLFTSFCGTNYSRVPFADVSGLTVRDSAKEELAALCTELAGELSEARLLVPEDQNGVMRTSYASVRDLADAARDTYAALADSYPTLRAGYGAPKPVFLSRAMSQANITGIFFPFTYEANVNIDIPAYAIPSTMCHELTHLRGYMREDEANFIAYLACRESGSAEFRYSGLALAFVHANNALYAADAALGNACYEGLGEGVKRDFAANSAYWKQFEGPVAELSEKVNDSYLKANRQDDGVKSYGRMVDLLLADYRARHALS